MESSIRFIDNTEQLIAALPDIERMPILAVDCETTGLDPFNDKVILLQLGDPHCQFIIDCRKVNLEPLRPILVSAKPKVLHHAKFDYKMLKAAFGIEMENMVDTMIVEQVLTNGVQKGGLGLKDLAQKYLDLKLDKSERDTFIGHQGDFSRNQLQYAARDIIATYQIALAQLGHIKKQSLESTARLECLAIGAFGDLEVNGILLDKEKWTALVQEARRKRDEARAALDREFQGLGQRDLFGGVEINYESEQQLRELLGQLVGRQLPDTQRSTLLRINHPVIKHILQYREQQKIVSTYGEGIVKYIHPATGRIHPEFRQLGAESGRVSCSRPNLQNIPAESEFRSCFVAPPGRKIVTADYSQIELRILAEYSQDPVFIDVFKNNQDLHSIVASQMFRRPVSKTENKELRAKAKIINFGLAYGMGPNMLATTLGTSVHEAETLLHNYFKMFPKIKEYLDNSARLALERGYAETLGGRKRYFDLIDADDKAARASIERQAKNMPIQGTNADMLKLALVVLRQQIKERGLVAKLVNTVHDEIVVECDADAAEEVADLVKTCMISAGRRFLKTIPVEVEYTIADCWSK